MKPSSFDLPQPQRIVDQHPHSHTDNIRLAPFVIDQNVPRGYAETIETTCRRPEIHVLAAGMRFSFDADIDTPFRVEADGKAVILGPQALADPAIAALSIRHALELALWQRLASSHQHTGTHMAVAVIALRVAASYYQSLQPRERDTCLVQLPRWLRQAIESLTQDGVSLEGLAVSSTLIRKLLPLQGIIIDTPANAPVDASAQIAARAMFLRAGHLAAPVEHLLIGGGDTRLAVGPQSGLNMYGCTARPRPSALTFSSSTASSISEAAYDEAERLRQTLIAAALADTYGSAFDDEVAELKAEIVSACGARKTAGAEVILAPSGTDAELFALNLARTDTNTRVLNIVIAPDETGSAVMTAAAGKHFASETAMGIPVKKGDPIDGFESTSVDAVAVSLRDDSGELRPIADIDADVEGLVRAAVDKGWRCLVHLLDCSKTNAGAPSIDAISGLQARFQASMDVVVDACQMRAGPKTLNAYLERGYMVMVTGSKFFTGPPFSGALLVPRQIGARVKSLPTLPAGFADYSGRSDWPQSWDTICRPLTSYRNLGMLLRWKAAITEMRMFEAVGTVNQHMILSLFMQSAQAAVAAKSSLDLVRGSPLDRSALRKPAGEWDEIPTILPFTLSRRTPDGASHKVDFDDARKVYHWLNTDITTRLPVGISDDERRLAATLCHAGQPVKVGSNDGVGIGALRLCASARIVSRIALDMASGSETLNRLWQSTRDALTMLDKAELIIRHFDHLDAEAAMPQVPVRCAAV